MSASPLSLATCCMMLSFLGTLDASPPPQPHPTWECSVVGNQARCVDNGCQLESAFFGFQSKSIILVTVENKKCCYPTEQICQLYCKKAIQRETKYVYCGSDGHCGAGCNSPLDDCPIGKRLYDFDQLDECNEACNDADSYNCFSQQ